MSDADKLNLKIGTKEIEKALASYNVNKGFTKNQYEAWELDKIIQDYYGIDLNTYEEATENSGEFENIDDVFCYIDSYMQNIGYESEDLTLYIKKDNEEKEPECEGQLELRIMDSKQLKWREKYINAVKALQELIDYDKTIQNAHILLRPKDRTVIISLDLFATKKGENVTQKVTDFIPDFILEEITGD